MVKCDRRIRGYLFSMFKFFSISWIQAFGIVSDDAEHDLVITVRVISLFFMVTVGIVFTERFAREVISNRTCVPLSLKWNRLEFYFFFVFATYSAFTAVVHWTYLLGTTENAGNRRFITDVLEVAIRLYIIWDKLMHFHHGTQRSCSIYLEVSKPLPSERRMRRMVDMEGKTGKEMTDLSHARADVDGDASPQASGDDVERGSGEGPRARASVAAPSSESG